MFEKFNIYQQQMDLMNRLQPIYSSGVIETARQALDAVHMQMTPAQELYDLQSRMEELVRPFYNLEIPQQLSDARNIMRITMQLDSISNMHERLNRSNLVALVDSLGDYQPMLDSLTQAISLSQMTSATAKLNELFDRLPDSVYDSILLDEEYTKKDIEDELAVVETENAEYLIKGLSPAEVQQKWWERLWIKHPKLAGTLVRMVVALTVMGVVTSVDNFIESVVIPAAQSAIVHLQEKQDTYYVKVDVAKIYKEPNSHAVRLTNALYGDLVYKIDDAKMWARVSYQTSEGKTVIGWVAKRNLMSYSDYEFHSDKLYE